MKKPKLPLFANLFALLLARSQSLNPQGTTRRALQQNETGGFDLSTCPPVNETESNFTIQIVNMGEDDNDLFREAFEKAADRWRLAIVGDWFRGIFSPRAYSGPVDDVVIGYEVTRRGFDGPGGTLGQAGTLITRRDPLDGRATTPISGVMQFDLDDIGRLPEQDVQSLILHEMGHVLGLVGTVGRCTRGCNPSIPESLVYQCPLAVAEYEALIGPGRDLLLENGGGFGTVCGHWESTSFRTPQSSELMTGALEANILNPMSLVTVAALADIGYEVDYCGADFWPAGDTSIVQRHELFSTTEDIDPDSVQEIQVPIITIAPTTVPTGSPTIAPSDSTTPDPSSAPVENSTLAPTDAKVAIATIAPVVSPTRTPTLSPVTIPVARPILDPVAGPTDALGQTPNLDPTSASPRHLLAPRISLVLAVTTPLIWYVLLA